ncbi:hypothetical protein ACFL6X_03330 [Candidatus Latescibacterota bacterium]
MGAQYTVLGAGPDRVLKLPNTLEAAAELISTWAPHPWGITAQQHAEMVAHFREESVPHVVRLAGRHLELSAAVGHPHLEADGSLTQDRVTPLSEVLESASPERIRSVLVQCAELTVLLWRYGIYVRCFSYADNNGVRADGGLVQLDFGESSFDTAWVSKAIEDEPWLDTWFATHDLPADSRDDYLRIMQERLTREHFDRLWASSLGELDQQVIAPPPIGERKGDIPALAQELAQRAGRERGHSVREISHAVLEVFDRHPWKGAGTELQNALYRAAAQCSGACIEVAHLPKYLQTGNNT